MATQEAVLLAIEWILRRHRSDLVASQHVTMCFLPNFGHGDDIWLRTELLHLIAEVTTTAANERWRTVKGPKRQAINRNIQALRRRSDVTHRYLFVVGDQLATSLQRHAGNEITVVPLPVTG